MSGGTPTVRTGRRADSWRGEPGRVSARRSAARSWRRKQSWGDVGEAVARQGVGEGGLFGGQEGLGDLDVAVAQPVGAAAQERVFERPARPLPERTAAARPGRRPRAAPGRGRRRPARRGRAARTGLPGPVRRGAPNPEHWRCGRLVRPARSAGREARTRPAIPRCGRVPASWVVSSGAAFPRLHDAGGGQHAAQVVRAGGLDQD